MKTKRFDIGEYCKGGSIRVTVMGQVVDISICQYKTDKPIPQGTGTVLADDPQALNKIENFLNDYTSSYHAGKVTDWIKTQVKLPEPSWF